MERTCTFNKETTGSWFIDLPEWEGSKADLQMVLGANTLLDLMSQGNNSINVLFSTDEFKGSDQMLWYLNGIPGDIEVGGAMYHMETYKGLHYGLDLWLCDVTKFVFGEMPNKIYFKCVSEV